MKKYRSMLCTLSLLVVMRVASAHVHLQSSIPADRSELAVAPKELTLVFEHAVHITAAKLALADGKLADGKGEALTPLPKDAVTEATLALPALKQGSYLVSWRAAGHDGHVMSGEIKFTVK